MVKEMSEYEVSESVRKFLIKEYHKKGNAVWHFEAIDTDGLRSDLLLFIEYQSTRRQWITHSVESKIDKRYVTASDNRMTCKGVQQARNYYANYRWLAVSRELYNNLTDEQWIKLCNDCKRTSIRTGLIVAYKTTAKMCIKSGYFPESWIEYYKAQDWILEQIEDS